MAAGHKLQNGMSITLSMDHLKYGDCESPYSCPIALCLAERLGIEQEDRKASLWVGTHTLRIVIDGKVYLWQRQQMGDAEYEKFTNFVEEYDKLDGVWADATIVCLEKMEGLTIKFGKPQVELTKGRKLNPIGGMLN